LAMSPGRHVPSSFGPPIPQYCAVQRQAWRVQARPKGVEPALGLLCAPVVQKCVPQPVGYHLLQVAPSTRVRAGRLPLRDGRVLRKPSTMKASMD
jgi:hypothetical protein